MGNINGKVMVNNHGLLRVKGGNHRAWHLWGQLNQKESENTMVFHFPIRSKESFIRNVENRARLLENGVHKMGDHYRRWVKLYRDNRLEEELERLTLSANDAQTLTKFKEKQKKKRNRHKKGNTRARKKDKQGKKKSPTSA